MTAQQPSTPLRVAIIGSGPSGFYAAEHLLKQEPNAEVDMYDRLPTPYGLVRGGVAPDHPKIKSVTKVYDKIADDARFRFFGNVDIGNQITHEELTAHYHAVIYAVGAQTDRRMGVPGEDLLGSHPATEFVAWYNGHPDYRHLQFDLTQERVAVVGNGNVAMDVARILARTYDELRQTDIADYALEALRESKVKEIYVLGRRGPVQAAFTNPEIKELGEMEDAEVVIAPDEVALDALSQAVVDEGKDRTAIKNWEIMKSYSVKPSHGARRKVVFHFLVSPTEVLGTERVEGVRLVKNELLKKDDGSLRPRATNETFDIPVGLIFRSIGYMGLPLPGVPFHESWGVIPNVEGRVVTDAKSETPVTGVYVVGWIKRGPSGIIGTNKPDSHETVDRLLQDYKAGNLLLPVQPSPESIEALLRSRTQFVTYADWKILDELEVKRGETIGRPRVKFTTVDEMLAALAEYKQLQHS